MKRTLGLRLPNTLILTLWASLPFWMPGPASASVLAQVENNGNHLIFQPVVQFARMILTVTGPCDFQYRQAVSEGSLFFPLDATTIDGVYRYHLMREETVDPAVIEVLQEARANFDTETPKQLCRDGKLPGPPLAQSDGFQVFEGQIIFDPVAVEKAPETAAPVSSPVPLDFVVNDDLIVDGSACIGFDCVNGESFGFDTVRLKEVNLRIKFDDTSVGASFPRNDWQLTANSTINGGASKFSIDDVSGSRTPFTVEAGARDHSLYVDDGGRIGNRTSTPSTEIHTIDGDTPILRLQQDGSTGFTPQTWDVAGNEAYFFIRDVTNGNLQPFRIRPDAPTNSIFIDVDGDVGLGTSSPSARLDVAGAVVVQGGFQAGSSRTIKQEFAPVDRLEILERLRSLPIQSWSYRDGDDRSRHMGPVAEEFFEAFGLGSSSRHIDLVDTNGVTLAALQGVLQLLEERDRELDVLRTRLEVMEKQLDERDSAATAYRTSPRR